jgi:hypothetical protein
MKLKRQDQNSAVKTRQKVKRKTKARGTILSRTNTSDINMAEKGTAISNSTILSNDLSLQGCNVMDNMHVQKHIQGREMSALQERINGVTTLPAGFYCFLFLLSGSWLDGSLIEQAREMTTGESFEGEGCISISWIPNLHAVPPLPVIVGALSMILHMPFSFLYHWKYAHRFSTVDRINHWSRRMDQSMLHVYSALLSYAFSGRLDFFMVNLLFNIDCIYRQFEKQVIPRRNQTRLIISIIAYTLPILQRGDYLYFGRLWGIMGLSFLIFATYPIGGWSHTLFHLLFLTIPPLMMNYIPTLPASQDQLNFAANCAVFAESSKLK